MKYADYQQIQFNRDKAYWSNLKTPFKLEFYHQGMYFDTPVKINEVTATTVKRIKYSPDYFNFGDVQHDKDTVKDLGFAGFKVLYPINSKDKNDEIVSMLGASYFRVWGPVRCMAFLRAVWLLIPRCLQVKNFPASVSSGSNVRNQLTSA